MVKTPEEYFADQCLAVPQAADATLSAAEQAFVQKYLGSDALQTMPQQEKQKTIRAMPGMADMQRQKLPSPPCAQGLRQKNRYRWFRSTCANRFFCCLYR